MRPTTVYIRNKFAEFNTLCFEGTLQPIPVRLTRARTFLGKICYKRRRDLTGRETYSDFELRISIQTDLPENVVEDTILHEMIHYWILSNQWKDTSAHGRLFRAKMHEINSRFGRNITITHRKKQTEIEADRELRHHLVCITRFNDGRIGVTVAAQTRLFLLWDNLAKIPEIAEQKWYYSTDPFFNRYPRAITTKVYLLANTEDLHSPLANAKPLLREGNKIRVSRK